MKRTHLEPLEPRFQCAVTYGVAASGDPDVTGVLATTGPGLKDLGATGVRLFTNTSYLSSDFDLTSTGKIISAGSPAHLRFSRHSFQSSDLMTDLPGA